MSKETAENSKNCVSARAENQKRLKTVFPPRRKIKKQQKLHFRPGGNAKTTKNRVSATAETQKTVKTTFPPGRKHF